MSTADDLLFAPIDPNAASGSPDFYVRTNPGMRSYDWMPVTARAHAWMRRNLTRAYTAADDDGWVHHVSGEPCAPTDNPAPWVQELIKDNFVFKEITP